MSSDRRVSVSLSDGERQALAELAARRHEPAATTAARLVRAGLADAGAALDAPPKRRTGPATHVPEGQPPAWLPPSEHWAAVQALCERYPYELRGVPDDDKADRLVAERLAALMRLARRTRRRAAPRRARRARLQHRADRASLSGSKSAADAVPARRKRWGSSGALAPSASSLSGLGGVSRRVPGPARRLVRRVVSSWRSAGGRSPSRRLDREASRSAKDGAAYQRVAPTIATGVPSQKSMVVMGPIGATTPKFAHYLRERGSMSPRPIA